MTQCCFQEHFFVFGNRKRNYQHEINQYWTSCYYCSKHLADEINTLKKHIHCWNLVGTEWICGNRTEGICNHKINYIPFTLVRKMSLEEKKDCYDQEKEEENFRKMFDVIKRSKASKRRNRLKKKKEIKFSKHY